MARFRIAFSSGKCRSKALPSGRSWAGGRKIIIWYFKSISTLDCLARNRGLTARTTYSWIGACTRVSSVSERTSAFSASPSGRSCGPCAATARCLFDNFRSYLLFFAFLAYAEYVGAPARASADERHTRHASQGAVAAAVLLAIVAVWGWWANIKPMRQSQALIRALQLVRSNAGVAEVEAAFQETFAYQSFGSTEAREQLGSLVRTIVGNTAGPALDRIRFTDFALSELRKETDRPAADVKHLLFMLSILNVAMPLDQKYAIEDNAVAEEALKKSPTKQLVYFEVAQMYLSQGQLDRALGLMQRAWRLAPQWQIPAAHTKRAIKL